MTNVSTISAYSRADLVTPVRANSDYAASQGQRHSVQQNEKASFGPATTVTLSPEAQAILQANQSHPEKAADTTTQSSANNNLPKPPPTGTVQAASF